jgi:RNA polymerase sigma factor (TIGR02999 family)
MSAADSRARINEALRGPLGHAEVDALVPLVYDELRRLARNYLRRERPDHTLQPTALVHEAFERLVDQRNVEWEGRSHFLAIAAIAMRRLLLQHAEKRRAAKRGSGKQSLTLDDSAAALLGGEIDLGEILDLNACLQRLAEIEPRHAQLVELRVFAGMTMAECATHLGTSLRTAERDWRVASAWLRRELARSAETAGGS